MKRLVEEEMNLLGRPQQQGASVVKMLALIPLVLVLIVALVFAFYEGRKAYWDYQVREMCKQDGGFKIYETIELPKEKFNEWDQPNIYRPAEGKDALGSEYIFLSEINYYRKGNPQVARYHIQVVRRKDRKLLGESISYGRGGGDIPNPSYGSSFHCPVEYGDIPLLIRIFKKKIRNKI